MAEEKKKIHIDNTGLVFAISEVKKDRSPENFNKAAHLVQTSKFIVPASIVENTEAVEGDDGKISLENKKSFSFNVLTNKAGKKYMAVFTSPAEVTKGNSTISTNQYLLMDIITIYSAFTKPDCDLDGIVIDAFSNNFAVPKGIIKNMAEAEFFTPKKNEQVKLSTPPQYPEGFIDAVRDGLDADGRVNQMFVLVMERQNGAKSLAFVVDETEESAEQRKEIYGVIAKTVEPFTKGMHLVFMPIDDSFGKQASENRMPCYRK